MRAHRFARDAPAPGRAILGKPEVSPRQEAKHPVILVKFQVVGPADSLRWGRAS